MVTKYVTIFSLVRAERLWSAVPYGDDFAVRLEVSVNENELSELKQTIKESILVFTNASDIVISLYESGIMYAEGFSEQYAVERKLNQVVDLNDRFTIEREIDASIAFFGKLLPSYLIILVALLEDCLREICIAAAEVKQVPLTLEQPNSFTIEQAMSFFNKNLGVQFPSPWSSWEKIQNIQKLRNNVVNSAGLNGEMGIISDTALVDFCKTIIQFLEELQENLVGKLEENS